MAVRIDGSNALMPVPLADINTLRNESDAKLASIMRPWLNEVYLSQNPGASAVVNKVEQFSGGVNTRNGVINNLADGMNAKLTQGGASYARGIIDKLGSQPLKVGDGSEVEVSLWIKLYDSDRYTSFARFDNYDPYAGDGNLLGIERWSDNHLHLTAGTYAGTTIYSLLGPKLSPNIRYNLKFIAKIASSSQGGLMQMFVDGQKVAEAAARNNYVGRAFSKLRSGVTAVGDKPANLDFGAVKLIVR